MDVREVVEQQQHWARTRGWWTWTSSKGERFTRDIGNVIDWADAEFNNFGQTAMKLKRSASATNVSTNLTFMLILMAYSI